MVKRIAIASVFVAVLTVVGLGFSSSASADHCHRRGGGGYYASYYGSYPVYGPSVSVAYPAFYPPAPVRPVRTYRAYNAPYPAYPASASFRVSIGF